MIARLHALLTLLSLLLAAGLGGAAWAGSTAAALGLAALLLAAPAVLGLELLLVAAVHPRDAPWPRARPAQLLRAGLGEWAAFVRTFAWQQPFRAGRWPDAPARGGPGGPPGLLLVHGYVCNRGFWNRWLARAAAQGWPVMAVTLEPPFAGIDAGVPAVEAAVARLQAATGRPPLVVAHSMGGLVVRAWRVAAPGNPARIAHLLTLGSPHHGTWLARWGRSLNARQMRPGSPWLQALCQREAVLPEPPGARATCVLGHADNIVFPVTSAALPGAALIHVPATGHVALAEAPAVRDWLQRWQDGLIG